MTARRFVLALATIVVGLGGTGIAAPEPPASGARPAAITGRITADAGIFIPVAERGCKIVLFHPGHHELTGALEGQIVEDGTLVLDRCTGDGFYNVTAVFTGRVQGSEVGTAIFTAQGRLRAGTFIDKGHFALDRGEGGLAGVHAVGTFEFTLGVGGDYVGLAHFDDRSK
jgi:hypothetical protein